MAENAPVYVDNGDGWTYIGETDSGGINWIAAPGTLPVEDYEWPPPSSATVTVHVGAGDFIGQLAEVYRTIHDHHAAAFPKFHRHCSTCHPEMAPRPLAVDGYEYHRRQLARQRRRRRGH